MKDILEVVIKNLVDNAEAVSITEKLDAKSVCYEVKVAKEDMGKVIGKQGRIAKAIRTVVKAAANHENKRVTVEIV